MNATLASLLKPWRNRKSMSRQSTWVYCPDCGFELVAGGEWLGPQDNTPFERFRCNRCGTASLWDFDAPTPLYLGTVDAWVNAHDLAAWQRDDSE